MLSNIFIFSKNSVSYLLSTLISWILAHHKNNKSQNLLFINTGRIGDLVVSSALLENPDVFNNYNEVVFVVNENYAELFNDYSGRVQFVKYDHKKYKYSLKYRLDFLNRLRNKCFSYCINLTAARGMLNDEITLLSGAKHKYCLNKNYRYLGNFYGKKMDKKYDGIIADDIINEYEKHFELMKFLNKDYTKSFQIENTFTFRTDKINLSDDLSGKQNFIVIAPFSSERNRDWSKNKLQDLIRVLSNKYLIILLGSKLQQRELYSLKDDSNSVEVMAGLLKLNEVAGILKRCKLFIGGDSGLTHIALKIGIPFISLIGGGQFGRFFPIGESEKRKFLYHKVDCFGCEWNCIHPERYCITEVKVETVLTEANKILKLNSSNT